MNAQLAVDVFKNLVLFCLLICSPFLIVMLVIGLVTSIIQSVTSIQEATLTFAPKLLAIALLAIALGPWVLRELSEYTLRVFGDMVQMVG